jgi:hypothetical protein
MWLLDIVLMVCLEGIIILLKLTGLLSLLLNEPVSIFFSFDLDLTRIETRSKALNMIFNLIGVLKMPFPAIEYNSKNEWILHGIYF